MKIEIWSDIACPWCYIGKRRLERALAAHPDGEQVEIIWRSFELDPTAPPAAEHSLIELLASKYGMSLERARQMQDHVTAVPAEEGLAFHFDEVQPGNTFDAHRLIHLAHSAGKQDAMKERLLRAYFTDGASLSDHDSLAHAAADVGLDPDAARAILTTDTHADDVRHDESRARELGIRGVPFFLFNGEHGVSGAQPPEVFTQLLDKLQPRSPGDGADDGPACDDQGCELDPR